MKDKVLQNKQEALSFFIKRLLEIDKGYIGKIFLFGSLATDKPSRESDIDLLILGIKSLDEIREKCAEAVLDTWIKFSESVEPLIYCIDDYRYLNSFFLYKVSEEGKEVFSMKEKDLRLEEAKNYLELAEEYLEGAKRSMEAGDYGISIDAAYNVVELSAKGLLLVKGSSIPKTHGGIVGEFGKVYIRTGLVAKDIGRSFNTALELRNKARYDQHFTPTKDLSFEGINLAEVMKSLLDTELSGVTRQ